MSHLKPALLVIAVHFDSRVSSILMDDVFERYNKHIKNLARDPSHPESHLGIPSELRQCNIYCVTPGGRLYGAGQGQQVKRRVPSKKSPDIVETVWNNFCNFLSPSCIRWNISLRLKINQMSPSLMQPHDDHISIYPRQTAVLFSEHMNHVY